LPYSGKNPMEIIGRVLEGDRKPLQSLAPRLPSSVVRLVDKMMALQPEDRFASGGEVLRELTEILAKEYSSTRRSKGDTKSSTLKRVKIGAAIAVGAGIIGYHLPSNDGASALSDWEPSDVTAGAEATETPGEPSAAKHDLEGQRANAALERKVKRFRSALLTGDTRAMARLSGASGAQSSRSYFQDLANRTSDYEVSDEGTYRIQIRNGVAVVEFRFPAEDSPDLVISTRWHTHDGKWRVLTKSD
ncbi:MAG: hypothetical protein AAF517_07225, partial [Planctomycetota bacterium]